MLNFLFMLNDSAGHVHAKCDEYAEVKFNFD